MTDFALNQLHPQLACKTEAAQGLGFLKSRSEGKIYTFYLTLENEVY